MQNIRTTLRIKENLKEALEKYAFEEKLTLQEAFNKAIEYYLKKEAKRRVKKLIFKTHRLGIPLDNLSRDDFYADPTK